MKPNLVLFFLLTLACLSACKDEEPPPPRSLASPAGVASARFCRAEVEGRFAWVDASRCEEGGDIENGVISTYGLLANRERESLMVVDFSTTIPKLVDLNLGEPGVTGIPVCDGPSQVDVTPDGLFAVVKCDIEGVLAVLSVPELRLLFRIVRDVIETDVVFAPDDALLASVRPHEREVFVERYAFTCEGLESVLFDGCDVNLERSDEATFSLEGTPSSLAVGEGGLLFVAYDDRPYVSRFDITSADAICLDGTSTVPCETARFGLVPECGDGLDNDGDGDIDQADKQCFGPDGAESAAGLRALVTDCTDGEDNDGDGLIDRDDGSCLSANDWSEEGGVLDPDCEDCVADASDPDTVGSTACNNGVDDDGDGVMDRADPGCDDPDDESEGTAEPVCSDGIDNDEDGLVDGADADCYGPTGDSEEALHPVGFGPISLQESERYLLAVDAADHQVLVIDVALGTLVDANAGDFLRSDLGLSFSDNAVAGRPVGYTIEVDQRSDDEEPEVGYEHELVVIPSSNGFGTAMSLELTHFQGAGEDREEGISFPMRPTDGNGAEAVVSEVVCELTDEYRDLIQAARGGESETRINCEDPEVARLAVDDEGNSIVLVQEQRFTIEEGELIQESVAFDYRLRDEVWTITFEGTIPDSDRSDGLIHETVDGLLVSTGTNFCNRGIEPGDVVVIESATPSLDAEPDACEDFVNVELEYEVDFVRADAIYLRVVEDRDDVVTVLPTRDCFAEGFAYEVRVADDTWLVAGSVSGMIHDQTSLSEQCVPATGDTLRTGRLVTGVPFANVFFSIEVEDSADLVPPARGYQLAFAIENNFATTAVSIGPDPVDTELAPVGSGRRLLVSDAGTNTLFVFDADTLLAITNLF